MLPTISRHYDLEPQKTKGRGSMVLLLIIILIAAVGGGVYYWQKMEAKKLATAAEKKFNTEKQEAINNLENKITSLEDNLNKAQQINNNYTIFKDVINGIEFQYPNQWNVSVEENGWLFQGKEGHFWLIIKDNNKKLDANGIKEDYYKNDSYGYKYQDSTMELVSTTIYKQARYDLGIVENYYIPKNNKIFNLNFEFNFTTPDEQKSKEATETINKVIESIKINEISS